MNDCAVGNDLQADIAYFTKFYLKEGKPLIIAEHLGEQEAFAWALGFRDDHCVRLFLHETPSGHSWCCEHIKDNFEPLKSHIIMCGACYEIDLDEDSGEEL